VSTKEKALSIVTRLREEGHLAYLAGGCVRDGLLGKEPKDYDIATDAEPEQIQHIFPQTLAVGSQFGVVMVILDRESFAVTTFRFDGPYLDGRHPSHVRFGTLEEDVARRDFTINGMMLDPEDSRVIDLIGGQMDLKQRVIRAIGDPNQRFEEDRLRMIRAIRFAAGLNFTIEDKTLAAIRQQASKIIQVAWERIGDEITRVLTEGGAKRGFELMNETGLLKVLMPEIENMNGVEQSPNYHPEGDVFSHTMNLLGHLDNATETLAYGCLLHDVAKPVCFERREHKITFYNHPNKGAEMAVEMLKRFKRSRSTWERVEYLVRSHLHYTQAPNMRLSTLKKFLGENGIGELLELCRIDALSSNGDMQYYNFCRQKLSELKSEEIHPAPLLRGKDLIAMGFPPGPIFQTILKQLEEGQLNGEVLSREQAREWVIKQYGVQTTPPRQPRNNNG
jgi:poly(A) polymerase